MQNAEGVGHGKSGASNERNMVINMQVSDTIDRS